MAMRSLLLANLDNIEESPQLIYFLSTLSLHCFTNEYVYFEKDEETELLENLETQITHIIANSKQPAVIKILCLASYRSLHQYNWCQQLDVLDHLQEVKSRLIEEPLAERVIKLNIPVLSEISDEISVKVRKQYEANPYPRWVKLGIPIKPKSISVVCDELKLQLHCENIKNVAAPFILIAGCGTGQHSIEAAARLSNCHVTAVDLSHASLAYAKRKSNELRFTNIDYLQADILNLDRLEKEFDVVESVGVLHHMNEPMAGWRVLTNILKPGGLMKIGLYSELARQHIERVREEIALLGVGTSEVEMRRFRGSLAESHGKSHQLLSKASDFFSLSEFRDQIFHVQEHCFTFPKIKNYLDELGLKFCGFENTNFVSIFREFHGKGVDVCDLVLWDELEQSRPDTFSGMYQFWCQKL